MGKTKYQKSDLENSILSYLHKARASLKAVQIAKAVGMVTARDVNPTLYKLAKLNKVVFCDGKPPVWRLGVPLSEGASSQAGMGFRNTSGRWNVVTQSDNGLSLSGTADMSMCTSSYQRNYMPHLAGFHHSGSSVGQNACGSIVGGILTNTKVHNCHQSGYVMTSPGVKVKTHSVDVEIKAMSEKATCSTMFGQHTPMQQTLGSKGDGAPSQGGSTMFGQQTLGSEGDGAESHGCSMWVAQEQSDESSRESLEISGEDGKEVDNTIGQGYPGTPEGHCDMEVVHDTGVANMCQSAEIQDSTSSESSTEGKGLSVLNDQVRLLRALSTSDEQSVSSSPEDYSERFPVFGLNANFNISQSGCMSHDTDLQKRVLHCLALSPKQHCSTLHLVQSLQLGCKKDINAMLYDMSTHGLIYRVNDSPPHWQIAPPGQSLLQDRAVGKIPGTVASFVKCDSTNEAAGGSQMHQIHNTTHMSGAFRIPLSPAEMIKSGALYGPTGGATSEPSASRPLGVCSQSIVYHRIGIGRGIQLVQNTQTVGHTDSEALLNALKVHDPVSNSVMSLMKTGVQNTQEALTSLSSESFAALNKNPVSALMEFAQSRKSTATIEVFGQTGPSHNPRFRMAAVMGRRQFPYVTVSNKKEGKNEAAEVAVRILMSEEQIKVSNAPVGPQAALGVQATHFDKMAALCHQTFHLIISGVSVCMPGRKVMAGLVMKNGTGDDGKVITLGSGNRCITGESLSLEGQTVNDSHAEIITRRSFLRFLYRKLQAHIPEDPETIFEEAPSGKLRVKPGITFHLYITTAPCGDGALMSQRDAKPLMCNDSGTEHHPTFSSAVMGLLRTKIEGGEGTLPIKSDFVEQTWDGIVRGERLRTMSCSDKICRWNIVGMQGALLSHFLEPIYLSSLTLGYLYEESHLSRAVCCRLVHGEPDITPLLQSPYHVNHPQLGRVTLCDAQRETQKTKQYSVNWCDGDRNAEVTDGTRGICLDGNLSQVCKSVLYKDFKTTCQKLGRTDLLQNMTYLDAKQKATEFQEAKRLMTMKFKATGFGIYTELVSENPHIVRNVESGLRVLSYLVPGSGEGGTVLSEMLYATSSMLTMLHDSIYRKVADIKWKVPVPHRQLMTWLTVLEHVEVFLELSAGSVSRTNIRWLIIICIHVAKAAVRFLLLLKHNSGIQASPLLPPLNRTEYKGHNHRGASSLGDTGSSSSMTSAASITSQKATFTLERSGRTIRSLTAAPSMSERCWKVPAPQTTSSESVSMDIVYQPTLLTQKQLLGEILHVIRPLGHLLSLYVFGLKSWKPWLLSCAVDTSSLLLLGDPSILNPVERVELRRRALLMVLYLLRSPFYDRCTRIRLFFLLKLVEHNIPLSSVFMKALINYIPPWQRTYFYVWMS